MLTITLWTLVKKLLFFKIKSLLIITLNHLYFSRLTVFNHIPKRLLKIIDHPKIIMNNIIYYLYFDKKYNLIKKNKQKPIPLKVCYTVW